MVFFITELVDVDSSLGSDMTDQQHYLVVDGGNSTELISAYGKEYLNVCTAVFILH